MIAPLLAFLAVLPSLALASGGTLRSQPVTGVCSDPAPQESGYFDISNGQKHYFYYMASSRGNPATDPVVLWQTGGPGCSSLLAAFTENGPCLVPPNGPNAGKAVYNPYAWNSNATMIWLDQPAGVGFSWGTENDKDEAGAAIDAYDFLQAFFKAHTALQALPLYVVGESYGGHYTPALTYQISQGNKKLAPGNIKLNLKGLGVGNGLTVPLAQYPEYSNLAYNWTMEKLGKPVITLDTYKQMQAELKVCLPAIEACQTDTAVCALAQSVCNNAQIGPYEATGLNPYDFRIPCEVPGLCYDESKVTAFFNLQAIQKALGVDHQTTWQTCNYDVNGAFSSDWMKQFADPYISSQLEEGTRVLIYAGDVDFICNWLGNQAWTLGLEWSGQAQFNAAKVHEWSTPDGDVAGKARTFGNFTFLQVFNAGHMVPSDQPKAALALLNQLIGGKSF